MTVHVLPDAERVVSTYLRSRSEVFAVLADRVYTEIPKKGAVYPLVRITRVGGGSVTDPRHLDAAVLQLDGFGGSKYAARLALETCLAALDQIAGYAAHGGFVTGAAPGSVQYLEDDGFVPAKPRYVADATVYLHPSA